MALGLNREILGRTQGRWMNLQTLEEKALRERLNGIIEQFKPLGKPEGICVGMAGCEREQDKRRLDGILKKLFPGTPCLAESDARIGLYAAFEEASGILLIAGTGSIAIGQDRTGHVRRAGGWGYLLGDEGSGYALAREAIRVSLSGRRTRMTSLIQRTLKLKETKAIIPWVYSRKDMPREIAQLAPLVFEAARKKDPAALATVEEAASNLCDLCSDLTEQLGLTHPQVAFGGGLLRHPTPLRDRLMDLLGKSVRIIQPLHPAPFGAALMVLNR